MILSDVRAALLAEAQSSPHLLSDLAGLEQYIAESYHSRSFIELLQNADDAGAVRFSVLRSGNHLFVANDGRAFTRCDFESLCRSATSQKVRGTSIGYRGIGFKSVVGFANQIHLFSDRLAAAFSRELTAKEVPEATRVPLIRIPHPVSPAQRLAVDDVVQRLMRDGYTTTFVFGDVVAREIEDEFASFDMTSVLFLRNVSRVSLDLDHEVKGEILREKVAGDRLRLRVTTGADSTWWTVISSQGVAVAFAHGDGSIVPLPNHAAVVHAFLPTEEPTGLGVKINSDVSTDPSRRHIMLDDRTSSAIRDIAELIVQLLRENLTNPVPDKSSLGLLAALIPVTDARTSQFKRRCFSTELIQTIQKASTGLFDDLRLRPAWLNPRDFYAQARANGMRTIDPQLDSIDGLSQFLRFLGAREATVEDIGSALASVAPSEQGCAEVVASIVGHAVTGALKSSESVSWRIWPASGLPRSLQESLATGKSLDQSFIDMISERGVGANELRHFLTAQVGPAAAQLVPPTKEAPIGSTTAPTLGDLFPQASKLGGEQPSLKKWRSAEQQVADILAAKSISVTDVSRQNVGYDLEGVSSTGELVFVEVKLVDYPGQPFTLTTNEEAVAREKGSQYVLAIVRQDRSALEVAFIRDPARALTLVRQCRQWVWECSSYDFCPERFQVQ